MRNCFIGILTGAALAGLLMLVCSSRLHRVAAQGAAIVNGAGDLGEVKEQLRWTDYRGSPRQLSIKRLGIKIPQNYGTLIAVHGGTFWFQDKNGVIRNVILGTRLYQIER